MHLSKFSECTVKICTFHCVESLFGKKKSMNVLDSCPMTCILKYLERSVLLSAIYFEKKIRKSDGLMTEGCIYGKFYNYIKLSQAIAWKCHNKMLENRFKCRDLECKKDGSANLLVITLITEWKIFASYYNSFRNRDVGWWEGLGLGNKITPGVTLTDSAVFPGVLPREAVWKLAPLPMKAVCGAKAFPLGAMLASEGKTGPQGQPTFKELRGKCSHRIRANAQAKGGSVLWAWLLFTLLSFVLLQLKTLGFRTVYSGVWRNS